jgi:hypothetical protein
MKANPFMIIIYKVGHVPLGAMGHMVSFTQWTKIPFYVNDMANNFITKEPTFVSLNSDGENVESYWDTSIIKYKHFLLKLKLTNQITFIANLFSGPLFYFYHRGTIHCQMIKHTMAMYEQQSQCVNLIKEIWIFSL